MFAHTAAAAAAAAAAADAAADAPGMYSKTTTLLIMLAVSYVWALDTHMLLH